MGLAHEPSHDRSVHHMTRKDKPRVHDAEPFMTYEEAADYLRISQVTLRTRVSKGEVPHYKIGRGGLVRFRRSELDTWMKEHAHKPEDAR